MTAAAEKLPVRRFWRLSLTRLMLVGVLATLVIGVAGYRIERNRRQREAVHTLWQMGALTTERDGGAFMAPMSSIDWGMNHREGWIDNLQGTHEPIAVLFREDSQDQPIQGTDFNDVADAIRRVPSIKAVYFEGAAMSPENVEKLAQLLPGIQVRHVKVHNSLTPKPNTAITRDAEPSK